MAKTGDYVVLPFGKIVGVFQTGKVTVQIPTAAGGGSATENSELVEFDQRVLRFVAFDAGAHPTPPIVIPPTSPGSPENPIVLPGTPGAHPDNTLPGTPGARPDNELPAGGARPDNTLPGTPSTKPIDPDAPKPGHDLPAGGPTQPPAKPK